MGELLIHEITPGVTSRPPPGVDSPEQDSASIALIIVWTLVVFLLLLVGISLLQGPAGRCLTGCCGGEISGSRSDPFTYKAPSESLFGRMKPRGGGGRKQGFGRLSEMELSSSHSSSHSSRSEEDSFAY